MKGVHHDCCPFGLPGRLSVSVFPEVDRVDLFCPQTFPWCAYLALTRLTLKGSLPVVRAGGNDLLMDVVQW